MLRVGLSRMQKDSLSEFSSSLRHLEFHVSRFCRKRYDLEESLFSSTGNVIFTDFLSVRRLARKINDRRNTALFPELAVRAGDLNAMGLIDEILHYVITLYMEEAGKTVWADALSFLKNDLGDEEIHSLLIRFLETFPPQAVYRGDVSVQDYLSGRVEDRPAIEVALEELVMLWVANMNPATQPFRELFDDSTLSFSSSYGDAIRSLTRFFHEKPPFGPDALPLLDLLRDPALVEPYSLAGQLRYIQRKWGLWIRAFYSRILSAFDLAQEEEKQHGFEGPGEMDILAHRKTLSDAAMADEERFTADREWMPNLILLAKSTHVWLHQLSVHYGRDIRTLDAIPDEELDRISGNGFTGLWLIGLWERSRASREIKRRCGNPEALASAYSLSAYEIAEDLGGWNALENLRQRAAARGIRLASDMVPNHMGIDSPWVIHHPDWFIQRSESPFPAYRFTGEDLSPDPGVMIQIEDHYYDRTDAAVVFRRVERSSGHTRYIYHGNDGTRMPWNDTAQLDYLKAEVREAVIQTILHVARSFPIIRFDAAMTLAKLHYQRLWYPQPGSGGDIPSRAEHAMTREELDAHMPQEFWREVVDRVAAEAPDTLLLAEAFWLMESYFVRTLGMHRVYNSAFMNCLKREENSKYRAYLKQVLEFNPEIMRRYVNFMNNPDEETAVAQFGKGDKYFGICTMMVTLPGLPMFGHGQVEGFEEKYGMEYRRAYREEQPDSWLVERHRREIFPLLKLRHLFSGVSHFVLYDFFTHHGSVDENVFAYSNRSGEDRSLVAYHNAYASTSGWIRTSVSFREISGGPDGERDLVMTTLAKGLNIPGRSDQFLRFRDAVGGLEYLQSCSEIGERGLYLEFHAYGRYVFVDFQVVQEQADGRYGRLSAMLQGRGVPSLEEAMEELLRQPILESFRSLLSTAVPGPFLQITTGEQKPEGWEGYLHALSGSLQQLIREPSVGGDGGIVSDHMIPDLGRLLDYGTLPGPEGDETDGGGSGNPFQERSVKVSVLLWILFRCLGGERDQKDRELAACEVVSRFRLLDLVSGRLDEIGFASGEILTVRGVVPVLLEHDPYLSREISGSRQEAALVRLLFRNPAARKAMGVHRYLDDLWFNREGFERLTTALTLANRIARDRRAQQISDEEERNMEDILYPLHHFHQEAERAHYRLVPFLSALSSTGLKKKKSATNRKK